MHSILGPWRSTRNIKGLMTLIIDRTSPENNWETQNHPNIWHFLFPLNETLVAFLSTIYLRVNFSLFMVSPSVPEVYALGFFIFRASVERIWVSGCECKLMILTTEWIFSAVYWRGSDFSFFNTCMWRIEMEEPGLGLPCIDEGEVRADLGPARPWPESNFFIY